MEQGFEETYFSTYQSYDIEIEAIPLKNASRAPATVPEYILHSSRVIALRLQYSDFAARLNYKNNGTQKGSHLCNSFSPFLIFR